MEIYLRESAKKIFYSRDIPIKSMGIFESNKDEWVYWYKDEKIYDTGFADTEAEAIQKAKRYIKIINLNLFLE
jgi:hypothetical protein